MQEQLPYLHIPLHSTLTRELYKTKDKGRERDKTSAEQWEDELQSYGYNTNSDTLLHYTSDSGCYDTHCACFLATFIYQHSILYIVIPCLFFPHLSASSCSIWLLKNFPRINSSINPMLTKKLQKDSLAEPKETSSGCFFHPAKCPKPKE